MEMKKAAVATLTLDKIDFKTKTIERDKERPSNCTSGCLFKEFQNTKSKRHMHTYAHRSIIYNSQDMEKTELSIYR